MYESSFYFMNKSEGETYSRIPQGKLIVNRVLKNQAPFKKLHAVGQFKPKSLIIADWTLENLEDWELEEVIQKTRQLFKDGFPVYLWQDGELLALTEAKFRCLQDKEIRRLITPSPSNKIIAAAHAQHYLIKDQVKILDKYELNRLLKGSTSTQNQQLYLSDLKNHHDKSAILATIRQAQPPFNALITDNSDWWLGHDHDNLENLLSVLKKELTAHTQYRKLTLVDRKSLDDLLATGEVLSNDKRLSLSDFSIVEKLTIRLGEVELKAEELMLILSYFPKLRSLDLDSIILSGDFQVSPTFTTIESLSMRRITTNVVSLERLLSACSLKFLKLEKTYCETP